MKWFREIQFIAAVAMPPEMADEFGTTVNGMWADPNRMTAADVDEAHDKGRRVLFSVPMIALTPRFYEDEAAALLEDVCRDVAGGKSLCDWYYWESKPVYSVCIYSEPFRRYLMNRCKQGVDLGMDVVNLDEVMTSIGLMNRNPGGSGFCSRCVERFRSYLRETGDDRAGMDDEALRAELRTDDELFAAYHGFHEGEAFRVMTSFIAELRAYADIEHPDFAISANVGYLGNLVAAFGLLWGALWLPHIDFVLLEQDYRIEPGGPHHVLPRGKFAPWYKLGSSIAGVPTWICPSIHVPRQLAGTDALRYYELMFLEAYANNGRWGYFWWPGVDDQARREATAPDSLKTHIRFIAAHRDLYEQATSIADIAILYPEGPIMRRPRAHLKYVALAQALVESGCQFDVLHGADGDFNPVALVPEDLKAYRTILVPEADGLDPRLVDLLAKHAESARHVVVYSESTLAGPSVRHEGEQMLFDFWYEYRDEDRSAILATVPEPAASLVRVSHPSVVPYRYAVGRRQVLHLLNYQYDPETDVVEPVSDLTVRVPWNGRPDPTCTRLGFGEDKRLSYRREDGDLVLEIGDLDVYALIVVE